MYHVLIFQEDGKYVLDSAGEAEEEGNVKFSSLDELVLFLTGHNLKVAEDEVQLTTPCPCADNSTRISSNCMFMPCGLEQYSHPEIHYSCKSSRRW